MLTILTQTNELLNQILTPVLTAIGALVSAALIYLIKRASDWLKSKTKSNELKHLIDNTLGLAEDIVITVNQTFVDELVKTSAFDITAQKQAFNTALSLAKEMISDEGKTLLEKEFGSLDAWLTVVIESKVEEVKNKLK